jgi:hypothetical protein
VAFGNLGNSHPSGGDFIPNDAVDFVHGLALK